MTGLFGGAGHCVISAVWSGCLAISCVGFRLNPVIGQSLHSAPRLFGASSILSLRASSFSFNPPKIFRSWLSTTSIENGPLQRGAGLPFGRRSGLNRRRDAGLSGPAAISFQKPLPNWRGFSLLFARRNARLLPLLDFRFAPRDPPTTIAQGYRSREFFSGDQFIDRGPG